MDYAVGQYRQPLGHWSFLLTFLKREYIFTFIRDHLKIKTPLFEMVIVLGHSNISPSAAVAHWSSAAERKLDEALYTQVQLYQSLYCCLKSLPGSCWQ